MKEKKKLVDFEGNLRPELINLDPKEQIQRVEEIVEDERPFGYKVKDITRLTEPVREEEQMYIVIAYDGEKGIAVYPCAYDGNGERIDSYRVVDEWDADYVVYDDGVGDGWVIYMVRFETPIVYTGPGTENILDNEVVVQITDFRTGYPARYAIVAYDERDIYDIERIIYYGRIVAYYRREMYMNCLQQGWIEISNND